MPIPEFSLRQLIESGVHFGHRPRRWNPKMAPYLFGVRNGIHIIDLEQTVPLLHEALKALHDVVSTGGRVLFVGTKRQAAEKIAETATRCGQYYVNHRWLGGMMTNWKTISLSIKRLKDMDKQIEDIEGLGLTKKEILKLERERSKLQLTLGGVAEMGGVPDMVFVVDTNRDSIAVDEAHRLNIPVIGVLDSNSNPDKITYPVPGNDDARRSINLYCNLLAETVLDGLQVHMASAGIDVGSAEDVSEIVQEEEALKLAEDVAKASPKDAKGAPEIQGTKETKNVVASQDSEKGVAKKKEEAIAKETLEKMTSTAKKAAAPEAAPAAKKATPSTAEKATAPKAALAAKKATPSTVKKAAAPKAIPAAKKVTKAKAAPKEKAPVKVKA
ncbi:MAG: 30S ribosomal protein S2 [Alphaproteobacteria bacterium]|nr:30S ribosomal protein S2 [Alphaproteobacteria bacterium]